MKRFVKLLSVLVIILGVVFALTGCGEDENTGSSKKKDNNEVVESTDKVIHGEYFRDAGYSSNIEMTFSSDNKMKKMVLTYDCATEEDAQTFYNSSQSDAAGTNIDLKIEGKVVTITMNAEDYMKLSGLTEDKLDEGTMRQVALGMGYNMKD